MTEDGGGLRTGGLWFGECDGERGTEFGDAVCVGGLFVVRRTRGRGDAGALGIVTSSEPSKGNLTPSG